jgi:hypothetical protein
LDKLNAVVDQYWSEICDVSKFDDPWTARLLSFEEAVRGVDSVPFMEGIPRQTSPGLPYVREKRLGKGKQDWFGKEGPHELDTERAI